MIIKKNFEEHSLVQKKTFEVLNNKILEASKVISNCLKNQGCIFWCGNGGSASDAMHLSAELIGRFKNNRKSLRSISLASDIAAITCISNDFGYENVFSRQLEGLGKKDDVLISMSTSGKSKNVINAIKQAKLLELKTVSLLGKKGGDCNDISDLDLIIPSDTTSRIQEMHLLIGHTICELVEQELNLN